MPIEDHLAATGSQDNLVKKWPQEVLSLASWSKQSKQGHIMQGFTQTNLENLQVQKTQIL